MGTLLDANVPFELLLAQPDAAVLAWLARQPVSSLFIGAARRAEMRLCAGRLPVARHRRQLQQAPDGLFCEDFAGLARPSDGVAAAPHVELVKALHSAGRSCGAIGTLPPST